MICGLESTATDATASAETEKMIGLTVKLVRFRRLSELQQ
jgi:hypothetical protein